MGLVQLEAPFEEPDPGILMRECSLGSLWAETVTALGVAMLYLTPGLGSWLLWQWLPGM